MARIQTLTKSRVQSGAVPAISPVNATFNPGSAQGAFGEGQIAADARALQSTVGAQESQINATAADRARGVQTTQANAELAGAVADDVQSLSVVLSAARNRLQAREDAGVRIRASADVEAQVRAAVSDAELSPEGMNNPDAIAALRGKITGIYAQSQQNLRQSTDPEHAALYAGDSANAQAKWDAHLIERGIQAGKAEMTRANEAKVGALSDEVAANPERYDDNMALYEQWHATHTARGSTREEAAATLAAGKRVIASSAVNFFLSAGEWGDAQRVMNDPRVSPFLGESGKADLRIKIHTGLGAAAKIQAEMGARLAAVNNLVPGLTPLQQASIAAGMDLTPKARTRTKADDLRDFTTAMRIKTGDAGWEPSEDDVRKVFDVDADADNRFGGGAAGRGMAESAALAPRVESGLATGEELDAFMTSLSVALTPDPRTGVRLEIPAQHKRAMDAMGLKMKDLSNPDARATYLQARENVLKNAGRPDEGENLRATSQAAQSEGVNQQIDKALTPDITGPSTVIGNAIANAGTLPDGSPDHAAVRDNLEAAGVNFFKAADMLVGPLSALRSAVTGLWPVGAIIGNTKIRAMRQNYASAMQSVVVHAIREGDRENKASQDIILDKIDAMKTGVWEDAAGLRADMIGLDATLGQLQTGLEEALDAAEVGRDRGLELRSRVEAIKRARKLLGVPPVIATEADFNRMLQEGKIVPGDEYRDPEGKIRNVPGGGVQ